MQATTMLGPRVCKQNLLWAVWEFPKISEPNMDPKLTGLFLQGHPQNGPPLVERAYLDPNSDGKDLDSAHNVVSIWNPMSILSLLSMILTVAHITFRSGHVGIAETVALDRELLLAWYRGSHLPHGSGVFGCNLAASIKGGSFLESSYEGSYYFGPILNVPEVWKLPYRPR